MRILLFSLSTLATTLTFMPAAFAACGSFELVNGQVTISSASKTDSVAAIGSKVCQGDAVICSDQARAKIKMEDGNEINISPSSHVLIETYQSDIASNKRKVLLNLLKGRVRVTTATEDMYIGQAKDGEANTFLVQTKSAVAGVRGTDFLVTYVNETQETEVATFRGKVEFGLPGAGGSIRNFVQVSAGQQTHVASNGQSPEKPRLLSAPELKKLDTESRSKKPEAERHVTKSMRTRQDQHAERSAERRNSKHH